MCTYLQDRREGREPGVDSATFVHPEFTKPSWPATFLVTSMIRPLVNGPRSLIRTMAERPLRKFVTLTLVPNGNVLWAAVMVLGLALSPLAVFDVMAYQDAFPHCMTEA